jgi:hypothetical protein
VDRDVSDLEEMGARFSRGRVARYPARGRTSTRRPRRSVPLFFSFLEALVPLMVLAGPRRGPCQCHDSHALAPPVGELAMAYATSLCELSTLARVTGSRCSRSPIPSGTDSWTVQEESSHGDEHVQALADDDGRISHSRRLIW